MNKDLNLTREQKIEKVVREGHGIAEKLKNAKNIDELDGLWSEIKTFQKFVDSEFGTVRTYEPYREGKDKYSHLSLELSIIVEEKERQLIYYPDKADIARRSIEEEFEEYLDSKDWVLESAE